MTNDAGFFVVNDLPRGTYYFQEYGSPNGYPLNDRLVKFEIKDNYEIIVVELENAKIYAKHSQTRDIRGMLVGLFGILLITSVTILLYLKLKPKKKD
ncbi:MSCRAMM family protein [Mycoplasma sp. P36-A1]|uniref:MSCRAMM family protein n=1 Tax=Mycoplasma sp. P36-A1 TaxID=3252900 RepID=UPI003C2F1F29